ncbi:hypothetical protein SDC9_94005 [bioreactor metagenome]|uniref:Uncharacterized protein n=1 Tax=bioreactor metagenome TaxID=1076179 RepID=A0A645A2J8_9ZZZZ
MKHTTLPALAAAVILSLLLPGCAGQAARSAPAQGGSSVSDVLDDRTGQAEESQTPQPTASPGAAASASLSSGDADVDLTNLSSTMVYAEVYNMMVSPLDYVGKTIKMRGQYYASFDMTMQQYYHFVVIEDATACCSQGLEFLWTGDHAYPEDYPKDETQVEVLGVFELYEEQGQTFCHIVADDFRVLS